MSEKQELNRENPFGTHAAANSNENDQANPFGNHAATVNGTRVLEGITRSTSPDVPKPLDISKSTNGPDRSNLGPVGSPSSANAAARIAAGQIPVHRVMIDFAPSMEDEVQLSTNDLVRLVTTYDDGWVSLPLGNKFPIF